MKKLTLIHNPVSLYDLQFDELYDQEAGDWQLKAERINQRREKRLRLSNS